MMKVKIPLLVELGMEVVLEIAGTNRFKFRLIGCLEDKYLILKIPPNAELNAQINLKPGVQVVARYHSEGQVFAFRSRILVFSSVPDKLLFIEYPTRYFGQTVRKNPRILCLLPATLSYQKKPLPGTIIDISESGCSWRSAQLSHKRSKEFDFSGTLQLSISFPGFANESLINCLDKNITQKSEMLCLGLAFVDLQAGDIERIKQYLHLGFIDENDIDP